MLNIVLTFNKFIELTFMINSIENKYHKTNRINTVRESGRVESTNWTNVPELQEKKTPHLKC